MPKQLEAPLGVHLVDAAQQVSRLMARAVLSPEPVFSSKKFRTEAQRVAQGIFAMTERPPASRQRALDDITERWCALAATGLEQMRTQRQTRRRPSVLALARDALAWPDAPQSRDLVEYAIVAGLRHAYGIGATLDHVEGLRQSCDNLAGTVAISQRRRALKSWSAMDFFALDLMSLHGHIRLAPSPEAMRAQMAAFLDDSSRFGVVERKRDFGNDVWPELFGEVPAFGTLLQEAYAQPLGIPGLDQVLGGLLPAFASKGESPGVVSLIVGPPGSGKTALCLRIARTLSQFGSRVRFLPAGESLLGLRSKEAGLSETRWWTPFCPGSPSNSGGSGDVVMLESVSAKSLPDVARRVVREFASRRPTPWSALAPAFPRVLVIDGLGALLAARRGAASSSRSNVDGALQSLRDAGVSVFLTCSPVDDDTHQLGYLADNVVRLAFEQETGGRHETRTLTLAKTRFQHGDRGRHILHVAGGDSVSVGPSLHSVLRRLEHTEAPSRQGLIHLPFSGARRSLAPRLVDPSHSLVFGWGPSGKAGFALSCLLSPRAKPEADVIERRERVEWARRSRTLVISFLYPEAYYSDLGQKISQSKHHGGLGAFALETWAPYPGFIDAETFVDQVQRRLDRAELEGRPFTGVLLDSIHTLLLEFPLLQADELLWPCLYRVLRARKITTVSTFTVFDVSAGTPTGAAKRGDVRFNAPILPASTAVAARSEQFLRMLVSSSDYTFNVGRTPEGTVLSEIQATIDARARRGATYRWDSESMSLRQLDPARG
jgi:hypothetical protein